MAKFLRLGSAAVFALAFSAQVSAQGPVVTAKDPQSIVAALELAGYEPTLSTDATGDPLIRVRLNAYTTRIVFYGCDKDSHNGCDSIQLSTGFDRAEPWTADAAMEISRKYRYGAVFLDKEGDPYLKWDIITGDGIPTPVFLSSVRAFAGTVTFAAEMVFAE